MSFCDWLVSLTITSSSLIHVVAGVTISFLFQADSIPLYVCITFCLSVDGHLGRFHLLTVVNNTAVNVSIQVAF